jgi:succinoglycan biosynthesis transport protein ExoP
LHSDDADDVGMNGGGAGGGGAASDLELRRPIDQDLAAPITPMSPGIGAGGAGGVGGAHHHDFGQVLWRGRWIIVLCIIAGVAAGITYLLNATPVYSSSASIYVEANTPKIINDGMSGQVMSSNFLNTQAELIRSSQILAPVSELPEIRAMKTFAGLENPIGLLKNSLVANVGQKNDLITLSFESPYPAEAAAVVNSVVEAYKTYDAGRKRSNAAEVLRILQKEMHEREVEREQKVQALLQYKEENPNLSFQGEKGNIIIEQLAKLSDALTTAHLEALTSKGNYESAKQMADDPQKMQQWMAMQPAENNPLFNGIQELELRMLSAKQSLGMEHGSIKSLQLEIDALKERIAEQQHHAVEAYLAAAQQQYEKTKQVEDELQKSFNEQQRQALSLNTTSAKAAMMEAEVNRLDKLVDTLDTRFKEVKVTEDADARNITVLEYAKPGGLPVKPQRGTVLFESMVAALLLGKGLSFLRSRIDHRIGSAEEAQSLLGLDVLGIVPHIGGNETIGIRGQKALLDPMSEVAEACRTIRTAIYFGATETKAKTILITSPTPGDGKTTLTSNLAIAMAQAGRRVLVLDCDFRKPTQHKIFGIEEDIGINSVINGSLPLGKAVKPTATRNLYVLPCGPVPENPSEILISRTFLAILSKLKEKFDHILIDSPPVVPVSDGRIIGASADITILVLRAQKSSRKLSQHALSNLMSVGARVLGLAVNDVTRGAGYEGYGYYYRRNGKATKGVVVSSPTTTGAALAPVGAPIEHELESEREEPAPVSDRERQAWQR